MAALDHHFVARKLWLLIAVVTFPLTALAAVTGVEPLVPVIFVTGYFLLVPLFLLFGDELADLLVGPSDAEPADAPDEATSATDVDPMETLKRQYASGEIDDREFERRVERLVALDDVDAADADLDVLLEDDSADGRTAASDDDPNGEPAAEAETDLEREL